MASVTFNLNTNELNGALNNLKLVLPGIQKQLDEIFAESALLIESDAKLLSPVDTGLNRAAISAVKEDYLKYKVVANTVYAAPLEYGTVHTPAQPFLFPAFQQNLPNIVARVKAIKIKF